MSPKAADTPIGLWRAVLGLPVQMLYEPKAQLECVVAKAGEYRVLPVS
jgi:hypothetical protein